MILVHTSILSTFARVNASELCREVGVEVFDLAGLLRALWTTGVRPKKFVRKLLDQMEETEGIAFKNKEAIFQRATR